MIISLKHGATAALIACSALLGGCVTDGYGYGPSGYLDGAYYDGGYYDGFGYGYGPGYGWYGDFYYPGSGIYVYDRGGRRSRWTADQRRYWAARRAHVRDRGENRPGFVRDHRGDRAGFGDGAINRDRFQQGREFRRDRRPGPGAVMNGEGGRPGVSRGNPGISNQNNVRPPRFSRPNGNPGNFGGGHARGRVPNPSRQR